MKLTNESNHKILGIIGGQHSCGIAYIENNEIKVVLEEERLIRQKPYLDLEGDFFRYPLQSMRELTNRYNVDLSQIDYFTSFLKYDVVKQILKQTVDFDLSEDKFIKTEHHETHCALAYYLSNFQDDTLVVAIDGSGEHHSAKYYVGTNGNMEYIDGIELDRKSLGLFYAAVTELIGFRRLKDEGKTVGMAGHGNFWKEVYDAFDKSITVTDIKTDLAEFNNPHDLAGGSVFKEVMTNFFDVVGSKVWKPAIKDVALAGQLVLEEKTLQILNNLRKRYPHIRKIALAGGIFANVRMNKRINELEWVDEIFIAPPMGDEGLALGSALMVFKQLHPEFKPVRLDNVFFGTEYNEEEINNAAREILGTYNYIPLNIDFITSLLNNQKIVGLFQGKFEHGPRALGNRTIMCDATHPATYDVINGKLQRNDFMPFAPAVLDEDADRLFEVSKSRYAAEFMTLCFNTREEWKDKLPTVVHPVDKTARVQIVTENSNPLFYKILKSYKEKTGIGCLVNTSFNVHNEPIVNRPVEAFTHLKNNIIDYLVTPYGIYSK